jgi:N-acetylmuramoyl-L-alanine amidase
MNNQGKYVVSATDLFILAQTVFGEARGESYQGKLAVSCVVRNRATRARVWLAVNPSRTRHPLFGDGSIASACRVDKQFSCWNSTDPNAALIQPTTITAMWGQDGWQQCLHAALSVVIDMASDSTQGATHYYRSGSTVPKWARGLEPVCTIGNHKFFNDVR